MRRKDPIYVMVPAVSEYKSFALVIHHSGIMKEYLYDGGDVIILDGCHYDTMSLVCIDELLDGHGLQGSLQYWWKSFEGGYIKSALKLLGNDEDVLQMARLGSEAGEINLYVKHLTKLEVKRIKKKPKKKRCVIQEIVEGGNAGEGNEGQMVLYMGNGDEGDKFDTSSDEEANVTTMYGVETGEEDEVIIGEENDVTSEEEDEVIIGEETEVRREEEDVVRRVDETEVRREEEDEHVRDGSMAGGEDEVRREGEDEHVRASSVAGGEDQVGDNSVLDDDDFYDPDYVLEDGDEDLVTGVKNARTGLRSSGKAPNLDGEASGIDHTLDFQLDDNSSEYDDSDILNTESESDPDQEVEKRAKRRRYPEFNPKSDLQDPHFSIGLVFASPYQLRNALRNHGIYNRVNFAFKKNNQKKIEVVCKGKTCSGEKCYWRVYASKVVTKDPNNPSMRVKSGTFTHDCSRVHKSRFLTAKWIGKKYLEKFRMDPDKKVSVLQEEVKQDLELTISKMKAYRAKDYALQILNGDALSQYTNIYRYAAEIQRSNPGSTVSGRYSNGTFYGLYICLNALKLGFKAGCRKFISLDGCWLKGIYGGQMLAAVGIDPNDCIFPIAYAVVETESTDTWTWFLELLRDDLDMQEGLQWTIMSDRQKGLINAVETIFPQAEYRFCVRHMYTNFRQHFKSTELKQLLWNAAKAPYPEKLNEWLVKIEQISPEAREWLRQRPSEQWSRACFQFHTKCDMLLNNLCEVFNKYILDARDKGIITMYEMIKMRLMKRIKTKADLMRNSTKRWCPKILKKLEKNREFAKYFEAHFTLSPRAQVTGLGEQYVVDLTQRTCSCRRWQLTGIPCSHGIAAIIEQNEVVDTYLDECYSVATYMKIYNFAIEPSVGKDQWPQASVETPVVPPAPSRTKKGRKIKSRRKEPEELEAAASRGKLGKQGVFMTCSRCGGQSHNRRTCKSPIPDTAALQPKRRRTETNMEQGSQTAQPSTSAVRGRGQGSHIGGTTTRGRGLRGRGLRGGRPNWR